MVAVAGRNATIVVLVLAGLAIGSLAGAGTSLAISLSPNPFAVTEIVFWLLGSFEDRSMVHVGLATPFILVATLLLLAAMPGLRALSLGDETARSLGIDTNRLRLLIVGGAAIGTGASVAVAGSIGFVGLVAPHLIRPFVGYDPARTMIPSGLAGAALLLAADCAVRLIPSAAEIKIGVLTALARRAVLPLGDRPAESRAVGGSRVSRLVAAGLTVRLGRRDALRGIDLALSPGRFTVVVGPNGAGKTTLLRSLAGLLSPGEGKVTLDGRDLAHLGGRERARAIAYLAQNGTVAWPIPVESVVALGRLPHGEKPDALPPRGPRSGGGRHRGRGLAGFRERAPPPNCPAASAPGCCSPGRSPRRLRCFSSTSRWRRSIRATSWWCSRS